MKADCTVCGGYYLVSRDGRLRAHNRCDGSYAKVSEPHAEPRWLRRTVVDHGTHGVGLVVIS